MKFTIGTASSSMNFEEDLKLIKSSLLYADTIELIGMAEYAIYKYLPKCFDKSSDIEGMLKSFIPFLESFDNEETRTLVNDLNNVNKSLMPYMPLLKKKKNRNKQEILAQIQFQKVEKQLSEMLMYARKQLMGSNGVKELQSMIDKDLVSVYDYSYKEFGIDEVTGG